MLARNFLITAFPDQNRRIVPEIHDGVPESRRSKDPGCAACVGFAIDARLDGNDSEAIGGLNAGGRAGAMPPTDKIATRFLHEAHGVEMDPVRLGRAEAGPFIRRLLTPTMQLEMVSKA